MRRCRVLFTLPFWFVLMVLIQPLSQAQTFSLLHTFTGGGDGAEPYAGLTMDRGGNLYGTTFGSGTNGLGNAFKLTFSNGSWSYLSLHDFSGQQDGKNVYGNPVIDASGTSTEPPLSAGPGDSESCGRLHYGPLSCDSDGQCPSCRPDLNRGP
jgi:hypothetical protein